MTADDTTPSRQAIAAQGRSGKMTVSGKLKVALDTMLFAAAPRPDAARAAGMTDHSLRSALKKPHVRSYYNSGLEVLRTSERAKNIKRLAEIRDAADNMPAVQAIKELEQIPDEIRDLSDPRQQPGLVIRIIQQTPASQPPVVDVTPMRPAPAPAPRQIEHDEAPIDPTVFRKPRGW